ncbi:MAG TPA: CHAT domain-containing protein [Noviherbaspirillum sp.]|nr:CHAT domain-containing protein [Noviherbaspirillum sp.]
MNDILSIKLELLREGPAHNQLLSPLTPYLALCGDDGPVTVHIPFEHRQLVTRLQRLRYAVDGAAIVDAQREAELREIGEIIGGILAKVPALLAELSNAHCQDNRLVHLRLSLSAFELGMLPFEAAIAPDGFPGSGSPLFLQTRIPIAITREIRRGRPLPLTWDRSPRILFAFASPNGLPPVPAQAHLEALRRALDPWVKIKDSALERVQAIKPMLTVLPDASLDKIRDACLADEYTHVHILAHGDKYGRADDAHFGIALCSDSAPGQRDVIDGDRLSAALLARGYDGTARHRPSVVTLATCDSGNANSVVTPGGSIAHQLHAAGIPWVVASQFPLWYRASIVTTEMLYAGFLSGADPRWVMHTVRQHLRSDAPNTHDWASLVAYTTVPWDFEAQVESFREKQFRRQLETLFDRFDHLVNVFDTASVSEGGRSRAQVADEMHRLCAQIRTALAKWRDETVSAGQRAERLGMSAASEKRIALGYQLVGDDDNRRRAYEQCGSFYRAAIREEPTNHWVQTQFLSIIATPELAPSTEAVEALQRTYRAWWVAARQTVHWKKQRAAGVDYAWTLATLAELELLGAVYGGEQFSAETAKDNIVRHCAAMVELDLPNTFPIASTQRQFTRYVRFWDRPQWKGLAEAALRALSG